MICIISCSLSLLVVAAGLFLLAKTKKEELGSLYKWMSVLIIAGGFATMLCCLCCCCMSCGHGGCGPGGRMECIEMERCGGMGEERMMMKECHEGMMKECGETGKKDCCKHHESGEKEEGAKADSASHK